MCDNKQTQYKEVIEWIIMHHFYNRYATVLFNWNFTSINKSYGNGVLWDQETYLKRATMVLNKPTANFPSSGFSIEILCILLASGAKQITLGQSWRSEKMRLPSGGTGLTQAIQFFSLSTFFQFLGFLFSQHSTSLPTIFILKI